MAIMTNSAKKYMELGKTNVEKKMIRATRQELQWTPQATERDSKLQEHTEKVWRKNGTHYKDHSE